MPPVRKLQFRVRLVRAVRVLQELCIVPLRMFLANCKVLII